MQFKLDGPGIVNLVMRLTECLDAVTNLAEAGTEACQAFAQKTVREMQAADKVAASAVQTAASLAEYNRRKQKMENEIKQLDRQLEERKRSLAASTVKPTEELKDGTKPLTSVEQSSHRAKANQDRDQRKAEAREKEKDSSPLTHSPFAALADIEAKEVRR